MTCACPDPAALPLRPVVGGRGLPTVLTITIFILNPVLNLLCKLRKLNNFDTSQFLRAFPPFRSAVLSPVGRARGG